jgi:hypothetical protein
MTNLERNSFPITHLTAIRMSEPTENRKIVLRYYILDPLHSILKSETGGYAAIRPFIEVHRGIDAEMKTLIDDLPTNEKVERFRPKLTLRRFNQNS